METASIIPSQPLYKKVLNQAIKLAIRSAIEVDCSELDKIPSRGPLILAANHVNFLDVPVVYTHLMPRPITGLVKIETWENPLMGKLFDIWGGIPVERGAADLRAARLCLQALKENMILAIAPEGTRSGDGQLQKGHPGIVFIALKSGAPIQPIAYFGAENYRRDLVNLKRISFKIKVGDLFKISLETDRISQQLRYQITDEIMIQIARLLPPSYRGVYSHRVDEQPRFLQRL